MLQVVIVAGEDLSRKGRLAPPRRDHKNKSIDGKES